VLLKIQKKNIFISTGLMSTLRTYWLCKDQQEGTFRLKVKSIGADFFQLGFSTKNFITLLAEPGEKIKLDFSGQNLFENYSVAGSAGSEKLHTLDLVLIETKRKLDSWLQFTKTLQGTWIWCKGSFTWNRVQWISQSQRMKNIEFILGNINSLASIKSSVPET